MIVNPFEDGYLEQEIAWLALPEYEAEGIRLEHRPVTRLTRMDAFLNVELVGSGPVIPILTLNGTLWMSLTRMEVQSSWVAIQLARGRVVTAGLGLGYAPLRMAEKSSVTEVVVYEENPQVIEMWGALHGARAEAKKVKVVQGDVRELLVDQEFDFCFMDIYSDLLPNQTVTDTYQFTQTNEFGHYMFWGQELALHILRLQGHEPDTNWAEDELFDMHNWSEGAGQNPPMFDVEYAWRAAEALGRV